MKTTAKLLSLFLVFCFLSLELASPPAWSVLIRDEPSGFRGNHWGDSPGDCPQLRFVKGQGTTYSGKQVDLYDRSTVGIVLNGVSPSRIRYRFVDNQLESVQLSYEGRENYDKLRQLMEERYGRLTPGERKKTAGAQWFGFESIVMLGFNHEAGGGSLWFISTMLNREFNGQGL
jgi:hypothetical protein